MESYDPSREPDPDTWLACEESERIGMVEIFHKESESELNEGSEMIHAAIHVIVENQIALKEKPVPETLEKLMRQGLDRHEAIHAIGAVLAEDMHAIIQGNNTAVHDPGKYRRRLKKLTAKRWRKGHW